MKRARRAVAFVLAIGLSASAFAADDAAPAETTDAAKHGKSPDDKAEKAEHAGEPAKGEKTAKEQPASPKDDKAKDGKPVEEKPKEKSGKVTLGGAEVRYIAQTGTAPIFKDDGTIRANVFYVYYAATDADGKRLATKDAGARPITFCFNGGPGAAAVWLHLGGLGPRKIDLPPDGLTPAAIARIVDNPNSILDQTDLVFIDPVSTGLSRAAKGEKAEQFFGVEEDVQAAGEFVRLFVTREQRWQSPKFLCGESYGVLRAAGLAQYLQQNHGMFLHGLVLMSGLVNFQTISADSGNDLPYILYLPAFAATAHFHKKLAPELQSDFAKTMRDAHDFAQGEYALALLKGDALGTDERRHIAKRLAHFTGLTAEQADDQELRIDPSFFRKMLLWKERKIIGRFDGRVVSEDGDRSENRPEFDPAFSNIVGPFSAAVNAFIRGELGYESDHPYHVLAPLPWRYGSFANRYASTESDLARALKQNPKMRVLVMTGMRDLAVPADAMRYSVAHLPLPKSVRANVKFADYESGHMMYLFRADAEKMRRDLSEFITSRLEGGIPATP